jgi:hypothetical protein
VSFEAPPAEPSASFLATARRLNLSMFPATPEAVALVDAAAAMVARHEAQARTRQRGAKQQEALRQAVGAFLGGVLWQWSAEPARPAACGAMAADFTGAPVSYRTFVPVRAALLGLGLVVEADSRRFSLGEGFAGQIWRGWWARYWPSPALLDLATRHGVLRENARRAFRIAATTRAPVVVHPVEAVGLKTREGGRVLKGEPLVLPPGYGPFASAAAEVAAQNTFAASFDVTGCTPPRWARTFGPDPRLHGRWYAKGASKQDGSVYQAMKKADRVSAIRIGGEEVVEMDVAASLLSVLHGLRGVPLPGGDPYAVGGLPRDVVKAWITTTIGRGKAAKRWAAAAEDPVKDYKAVAVGAAILARYPFLSDLAWCVPDDLRHACLGATSLPSFFLMGVEAEALTVAKRTLREQGVLALSMHDGLIVATDSQEAARASLEAGYAASAGVVPKVVRSR